MPERSFGDILRNERERGGYDIASMSRRLHVRPDILAAIENCDFDRMPARGYAKNMIRAYARALGLDERLITELYLEEVNAYELGPLYGGSSRSRGLQQSRSLRGDRTAPPSASRSRSVRDDRRGDAYPRRPRFVDPGIEPERARRDDFDDRAARSRSRELPPRRDHADEGPARGGSRQRRSGQGPAAPRNGRQGQRGARPKGPSVPNLGSVLPSFGGGRSRQDGRVRRSYDTVGSTPPYARAAQSQGQRSGGIAGMNLTMLLGIVAALIVAVILIVVFVNGGKQATNEVPNIPISGLTDTSSPEDQDQVSGVEVAPKNAQVTYNVPAGQSAWIEIYKAGSDTPEKAEVVDGPASETFGVTDSIKILTANPSGVSVSVNGKEAELTKEEGSSNYSITVDFAEMLRQWYAEHQSGSSSSSASSAGTAS